MTAWLPLLAAGILLGAATTKTVLWFRGELDWPEPRLPGGIVVGAVPVIVGETMVAVAAVAVPALAAIVLAAAYLGLTGASALLLGRRCACFGGRGVVGRGHVGLNATVSVLMVVAAVLGHAAPALEVRLAVVGVTAAVITAVSLRRVTGEPTGTSIEPAAIATLTVVVSPDCPACARLRSRLRRYPPGWIVWQEPGSGPWAERAEHTYPCAIATDAAGLPVGAPQWGVSSIARLADRYAEHRITEGS